jgi:ATP-dependent DNA ligase
MLPRPRNLPAGFVPPCLPMKAPKPPSGALWLHEIKHDGFRVIARKDGARVKLYSRPGNDLTDRFSLIVEALARLRPRSCIIDGLGGCAATTKPQTLHQAQDEKVTTFTSRTVVQLRFLSPRSVPKKRGPPKPSPTLRSPGLNRGRHFP